MKRTVLFLCVSVIFGSSVFSQSLSLKYGDDEVTNDSVYIPGEPTDDLMEWHLKVKNLSDKEIEVKVRKNEIFLVDGSVNTFCWGSCFMPNVYTSPTPVKIAANSTDFNAFAGDYEPYGMEGTSIISYTFYNVQDEADSVMVTAFYQAGTSGIRDIEDAKENIRIYPNPVKDRLNIEFPGMMESPLKIRIIDFSGKIIQEYSHTEGDTFSIPAGNFGLTSAILVVSDEHKVIATKKILFR